MEKRFMIRRFRSYTLLLIIPTVLGFVVSCLMLNAQMNRELEARAHSTLQNVNVNLDFVVSSVMFQNDQLTNNSYMVLALKALLRRDSNITYSDAIYMRNLKAMMSSILQSYPYIQSVYLHLDDYDNFFSSADGVTGLANCEDKDWLIPYLNMQQDAANMVVSRNVTVNGKERQMLTIYQRLLLLDGIVVMNIDAAKYQALLGQVLTGEHESVLFYNRDQDLILAWNAFFNDDVRGIVGLSDFLEEARQLEQRSWTKIGGKRYLVRTNQNDSYGLSMISLISYEAKLYKISQMFQIFVWIMLFEVLAVMILAYVSSKHSFKQLHYLVQLFYDAESGVYPTKPQPVKNEYDFIMNNIIYLFLQTVKLNTSLAEKEREQHVAELTALQLQINPHFLFNTLQNVQIEIKRLTGDVSQAGRILDYLSDILKYALADSQEQVLLQQEIQYLKKYVAIQSDRFTEQFIVYYEIEESLLQLSVFRLMLQPLVENSILHGIRQRKGYIKIQAFERHDQIYFRVVDNGQGMSRQGLTELLRSIESSNLHQIGLANVNRRLKLYYGSQAGLRIRSKAGWGCVVEFVLPSQKLMLNLKK